MPIPFLVAALVAAGTTTAVATTVVTVGTVGGALKLAHDLGKSHGKKEAFEEAARFHKSDLEKLREIIHDLYNEKITLKEADQLSYGLSKNAETWYDDNIRKEERATREAALKLFTELTSPKAIK